MSPNPCRHTANSCNSTAPVIWRHQGHIQPHGPNSPYWSVGTTSREETCVFKLSTTGTYYRKHVRFRVTDATGVTSAPAETGQFCWSPN
ncbi:hypothetical protein FJV41_18400 [Myxococcus llanfairpwllgwyngyllgogerychwyrndrobwllllantysiliogogogochensis]|uniref:Uncharacterized protein n=1 Tax=Myxococcus llanfairpwllgwyngyllgogerychwyrndrobwllllantysiliogogogochensis TaxID=2590453 RepID=A0A540WZR5_9BACT|nr:hypothetical protein [Myxococcus llanfairpwllgwyngyllgogerychwyrndrobwllllantysiliogogogochensis]TQF14487.1 hypothetical protein FJV41_18400 [Myxococcus llanfairpwllgwyngyllgogerychwyrndrobwllllantysiliogogogochensis]